MGTSDAISSPFRRAAPLLTRLFGQREWIERTPLPFRPASGDEVPAAAWSRLEGCCGELSLERLLVIPGTGKRTWIGGQLAMHARVIAFGATAVGQWTEDEGDGVVESVPVDDLLAIDDRVVLLHGRLLLIGKAGRLTILYNAVARPLLRESILWLRRTIAGPEFATRPSFVWIGPTGEERPDGELPYKWAYLLTYRDDLRIDPPANEMVAVGGVVELTQSRKGPATGLAVLGPRELVVAAEPPDWLDTARYGVDLTVVPRCHLRDVGWSGGNLQIRLRASDGAGPTDVTCNGATGEPAISRPLDGRLFEAMRRSFGDAVEWARP